MSAIRISACPFCGAHTMRSRSIAMEYTTIEPSAEDGMLSVNVDGFGWYWVFCSGCHAQGPKYHGNRGITGPKNYRRDLAKTAAAIHAAIEAWNDRAEPTLFDVC